MQLPNWKVKLEVVVEARNAECAQEELATAILDGCYADNLVFHEVCKEATGEPEQLGLF